MKSKKIIYHFFFIFGIVGLPFFLYVCYQIVQESHQRSIRKNIEIGCQEDIRLPFLINDSIDVQRIYTLATQQGYKPTFTLFEWNLNAQQNTCPPLNGSHAFSECPVLQNGEMRDYQYIQLQSENDYVYVRQRANLLIMTKMPRTGFNTNLNIIEEYNIKKAQTEYYVKLSVTTWTCNPIIKKEIIDHYKNVLVNIGLNQQILDSITMQ